MYKRQVQSIVEYFAATTSAVAQKRHALIRTGSYTPVLVNDRIPVSADALSIVERAVHAKDPLHRELEIARALWTHLDDCDAQYQYSIENVIVYGYKLKLFQKCMGFERNQGNTMWKELLGTLSEKAGFFRGSIGA